MSAADGARLCPRPVSTTTRVKTFKWLLEKVEDRHGNQVKYTYTVESGNNGDPWVQLYPAKIDYTTHSSGTPAATYSVVFIPKSGVRADAFSTGRRVWGSRASPIARTSHALTEMPSAAAA